MRILGSRTSGFTTAALSLPVLATTLLALPAPATAAATPRTVDSVGHGAYRANGNACGDEAVTDFLLTGERPARDTSC